MKNRLIKVFVIISFIIIILGVVGWFGTEILFNQNDISGKVLFLLNVFGSIGLRLFIIIMTIGIIVFIWMVYVIIIFCSKLKKGEFNWKYLIIILMSTIFLIFLLFFLNKYKMYYDKRDYDVKIEYHEGLHYYSIYKNDNEIEVLIEEKVFCDQAPCYPLKTSYNKINFSEENMIKVNNFIESFFSYYLKHGHKTVEITDENFTIEQKNILKSIIYNNESYEPAHL